MVQGSSLLAVVVAAADSVVGNAAADGMDAADTAVPVADVAAAAVAGVKVAVVVGFVSNPDLLKGKELRNTYHDGQGRAVLDDPY